MESGQWKDPYLLDPSLLIKFPTGCLKEKLWVLFFLRFITPSRSFNGSTYFAPNWGQKESGINLSIASQNICPTPNAIAIPHWEPDSDGLTVETLNASPPKLTMTAYPPAMMNQINKYMMLLEIPPKIFNSSWIFLALSMLNI